MKFGMYFISNFELFEFLMISREKQKALRSIRLLEKRLRDATTAAEDTEKLASNYKEQVRKKFLFFF